MTASNASSTPAPISNFIRHLINDDNASGKHAGKVATRFPPEPNGYLHLGHAKSICLNFGLAQDYQGRCNLRFDDTNPSKEDQEYVDAIQADVQWLGFGWHELRHASDYFGVFYNCAEKLINDGHAFVCDLNAEEVRAYRGSLTEPGRESPYRNRSVAENLDLFRRMRAGEFADGARTLRAKIDMRSGNINLRDPAIYRIRKTSHQNTGDAWCIYPMYDFAHGLSDALEGITHSICTIEFEDHRPLYDWYLEKVDLPNHPALYQELIARGFETPVSTPQQIEFARGNLNYTVMSKRKLIELVSQNLVDGWDDPRMPTLRGVRRRGYPAQAIRQFWEAAGVSKQVATFDYSLLENRVRDVLDATAERRMAVLHPLKVVLSNWAPDREEITKLANHPKNAEAGERELVITRELYIEQDDFMEQPSKDFHRLAPGAEVRFRGIGIVKCEQVEKAEDGSILALHCSLDESSRPGLPGASRKVKGVIHWVSAQKNVRAEVRLYDRLFAVADPDSDGADYRQHLNPNSKVVVQAFLELSLAKSTAESCYQFERLGYFTADRYEHSADRLVFNRTVTLRDSFVSK